MDGDHPIDRCEEVTGEVLQVVFGQLFAFRVSLEGMVLKPNMVVAGSSCAQQPSPQVVAEATVRCLRRHVPPAVPGIAFLSGGQSEEEATHHLNLINVHAGRSGGTPWRLTFSYGRALQQSALHTWAGSQGNAAGAQEVLLERARLNALAQQGRVPR
jgi:fructose-bisphosphate aldolase class I